MVPATDRRNTVNSMHRQRRGNFHYRLVQSTLKAVPGENALSLAKTLNINTVELVIIVHQTTMIELHVKLAHLARDLSLSYAHHGTCIAVSSVYEFLMALEPAYGNGPFGTLELRCI